MNWSKAKNILIIYLIMTAILLSYMLYNSRKKSSHIDPDTITYASSLLSKRGIAISTDLIPTTLDSVSVFEAENVITEYSDFASRVLPDCTKQSETLYSSENGTIEFNGDMFTIIFNSGIDTDKRFKSPSEKAKDYLSSIGIDVSSAEVDTSNNAQGLFTVTFTNVLDDMLFFDSRISVTLKGEKIIALKGTWFTQKASPISSSSLDSAPGLLVKFSAENKDFSNLKISSLTLGYAINEQGVFHKKSTIIPVYRILTTEGKEFYIDARRR